MPTDPPPANQTNPPGPLGQAQPPAQQLPQHQIRYQFAQQRQTHIPLHSSPQANPLQHPQYGISGQSPLHSLPPASAQRQPSQPLQPQQQTRPPMNQQQPFFSVNSFQQHINSYPGQQFPMGGYIYQSPTYPYPMPAANAPQQQPQVGARAPRQFAQPVTSSAAQRAPARTIPVPPPRKKNILQIVDPDTNEEVKVSKVEIRPPVKTAKPPTTTHPPVKIPPRRSHALELVSDPADESRDSVHDRKSATTQSSSDAKNKLVAGSEDGKLKEHTDIKLKRTSTGKTASHSKATTASTFEQAKGTVEAKAAQAKESSEETHLQDGLARVDDIRKPTLSSSISKPAPTLTQETREDRGPGECVLTEEVQPQPATKADNSHSQTTHLEKVEEKTGKATNTLMSTHDGVKLDVSKQKDMRSSAEDGDSIPQRSEDVVRSTLSCEDAAGRTDTPPSDLQQTSKEFVSSDMSSVRQKERGAPVVTSAKVPDASKPEAETTQNTEVQSSTSEQPLPPQSAVTAVPPSIETGTEIEPEKEDFPPMTDRPTFAEGQRRVYVPSFMWDMKSLPNTKKTSEYETSLGSRDILKNGSPSTVRRNDSRGNRPVRGGTGPLSADPRRAFPGQGGPGFQMVPMRGAPPPGMGAVSLGSYDAFDLRSARSQAPPPAPKSQTSVRDGDPRGTRQQASRGRFDGPTRQGQTPVDPFVMHPLVEKLKRTDKGWKRNREADDEVTTKVKTVRSLLNKLTLEKFEKIFKQIVDVGITSFDVLDGIVTEIFEKTLFEPKFSSMYAELCRRLEGLPRDILAKASILDSDGKPMTFRKILLNHCRDEFTRFAQSSETYEKIDEQTAGKAEGETDQKGSAEDEGLTPAEKAAKEKLKKEEEELMASKAKRRMLANVRFIGELFIKDLLREQIIHKQCIQKLLSLGIEKKEEDTLEALCKLISKTGAKLSENKDAINYIDNYFGHLHALSMDHTLPARIRFMLQDLIEQRANNWKVRREEVGAKTIAEIHQEVEKEERAKQEAQAAARERRSRGAGMHNRERNQQNFTPRVAMTMASSRRTGPNVSRTNSVIEKFGNRGTTAMPSNNLQSLRLGPGGARAIGAGGSGSAPLRPGSGTGMFGSFAALTDNRESGMNGQSGDVRRGKSTKIPTSSRRPQSRPQSLPPDKLKQKARSVVKEFWSLGLLEEVRQTLTEEIHAQNYPLFLEEAIRVSIDARVDESEKSVGLLRDLAKEPLSGADLVHGFSVLLSQLADLEMDNPRVTEFIGKYVGAVASTRKLPEGASAGFGLDFVARSISDTEDPKRVSKIYVSIFATLRKELMPSIPNEQDLINTLRNAYSSLAVDVAGLMDAWNPMRGLSSLEDMLKSNGISFLAPYIKIEQKLKSLLQESPAGDKVLGLLRTSGALEESLLRAVIRQSLDWILLSPIENLKESFAAIISTPLLKAFGTGFSKDAQMGALLEAQFFVARNLEILPPRQIGSFDKPGAIAFDLLYDTEIVSGDTFVQWKEDTGRSLRVPGKEKMVIQTSQFFQWLAQLQQ